MMSLLTNVVSTGVLAVISDVTFEREFGIRT